MRCFPSLIELTAREIRTSRAMHHLRRLSRLRAGPSNENQFSGFIFEIDFLCLRKIVAHHHRQRNLIAFSEHARRIVFDKEWLKRLYLCFRRSDPAVFSRANYGEFPGRDVVGEFEIDLCTTLLIRLE